MLSTLKIDKEKNSYFDKSLLSLTWKFAWLTLVRLGNTNRAFPRIEPPFPQLFWRFYVCQWYFYRVKDDSISKWSRHGTVTHVVDLGCSWENMLREKSIVTTLGNCINESGRVLSFPPSPFPSAASNTFCLSSRYKLKKINTRGSTRAAFIRSDRNVVSRVVLLSLFILEN